MKKTIPILLILIGAVLSMTNEEIQKAYLKSYNYEKIGDYRNAMKALVPVLKEYPDGYTLNLRMGWLFYLNKNYANSLESYEKAKTIAPYSIEAKLGHMLPLLAQQKYARVEAEAYQILNIDYYNYYGNLRLIFALRMQKKFELAEKVALKMLTSYPTDVSFLTEYGLIKFARGDTTTAVKTFYDVQILDPENVTAKEFLKK